MKTLNDYLQIVLQTHRQMLNRAYGISCTKRNPTTANVFCVVHNMVLIAYEQIAYGEY